MKADDAALKDPLRVRFDRFELDEANASLSLDGRAVPLAPRPFDLLCALARTRQSLVSKNALLVYREVLRKRLGRFAFSELQGRAAAALVDERRVAGSGRGAGVPLA